MDYVAHWIFRNVQERRGPVAAFDGYLNPALSLSYDEAAESFFRARCKPHRQDSAWSGRRFGVEAGKLMHDLLRGLPETDQDPDGYLYRMSFGLNASDLDDIRREQFVAQVHRYLPVGSRAVDLIRPVRQWAVGRVPLEDLYAEILALGPP
jgi:hypothetical protein